MVAVADKLLTPRWYPLRPHAGQYRFWSSIARFIVLECTRRGGKSELLKRRGVMYAGTHHERSSFVDGLYVWACPTRDQVKSIYWEDIKRLVPDPWVRKISEVDLSVSLVNGARMQLSGMDKPARIEGQPIDWAACDEFQSWKPGIYDTNLRPALSTIGRPGRAVFSGVARHSLDMAKLAKLAKAGTPDWEYHSWTWEGLLSQSDIDDARRTMDPRKFEQEYGAKHVDFQGRIYYTFDASVHAREPVRHRYNPRAPLEIELDFNVEPGVAAISQRYSFRTDVDHRLDRPEVADEIDGYIGEVWIPFDSNTHRVCRKIIEDWGRHAGDIYVYGDPAGGQRRSSADGQTDWAIVQEVLGRHFGFERVHILVRRGDPGVRARVNALNSRFLAADGLVRSLVDAEHCPHIVLDLEGTLALPGTAGEINKKLDPTKTHISDAMCYRAEYLYSGDGETGGADL